MEAVLRTPRDGRGSHQSTRLSAIQSAGAGPKTSSQQQQLQELVHHRKVVGGFQSYDLSMKINVLIPQPIQSGEAHYNCRYRQAAIPCRRNKIKVDKSATTQCDQRESHNEVYGAMNCTHEVKMRLVKTVVKSLEFKIEAHASGAIAMKLQWRVRELTDPASIPFGGSLFRARMSEAAQAL